MKYERDAMQHVDGNNVWPRHGIDGSAGCMTSETWLHGCFSLRLQEPTGIWATQLDVQRRACELRAHLSHFSS